MAHAFPAPSRGQGGTCSSRRPSRSSGRVIKGAGSHTEGEARYRYGRFRRRMGSGLVLCLLRYLPSSHLGFYPGFARRGPMLSSRGWGHPARMGSPLMTQVKGKSLLAPPGRGWLLSYWLGRTPPSGHLRLFRLGGLPSPGRYHADPSKPLVRRLEVFSASHLYEPLCPAAGVLWNGGACVPGSIQVFDP